MIVLSVICVVICAALLAVVALWQRRAAPQSPLAREKALYTGFVADVERRVATGEIDADQAREERHEAARALLKISESVSSDTPFKPLFGYLALGVTAIVSFGLYLFIGHPNLPDQPYEARLQYWTRAVKANPDAVPPAIMAAVLRQGQVIHAKDVQYWLFLGRTDMMAGNNYDGAQDYEKARQLSPDTFTAWSELGEALTFVGGGTSGPSARQALENALKLDPNDARANFYLGQQALDEGDYEGARRHFNTALSGMAPNDVSRPMVQEALSRVGPAEEAATAMKGRISGMVASLQAQLDADPDNPEGWARLLRSYDVLGDKAARAKAQSAMQAHYAPRPEMIADILTKAQTQVGSEGGGK
ncbi:MAG: c-type cytochrome biogenesis protein CcmI [Asticcacaulis sp.]